MPIGAFLAGASILKGIGGYISAKQAGPPKFDNTPYGKYLQRLSKTGMYNPQTQAAVLGDVGAVAGAEAGKRTSSIRGYLENRGLGRSIAGVRALDEPRQDVQRSLAETGRKLTVANEGSKVQAASEFAQNQNQYMLARRQANAQATGALFGGIADAPGAYLQGEQYETEKAYRKDMGDYYANRNKQTGLPADFGSYDQQGIIDWAIRNGHDPDQAMQWWVQINMKKNTAPVVTPQGGQYEY